jgi:hypothetical protein
MVDWRGPIAVTGARWTVLVQHGLPGSYDDYCNHAELVEEIGLDARVVPNDTDVCFVAVSGEHDPWPALVVAQRYSPAGAGCEPGVALPEGSDVLFIGAGERLLAYHLTGGAGPAGRPVRLWEDDCELGFFYWAIHGDTVVMSAELELAAWTTSGTKLWTLFVEPPWSYTVEGARVQLDMLGKISQFPLRQGPRRSADGS